MPQDPNQRSRCLPPEVPGDDVEQFLQFFPDAPVPLEGPRAACLPLGPEALVPYQPVSNFRTIELAHQLLQRGPYGLSDILNWLGDDVSGVLALYLSEPVEPYQLLADPGSKLPMTIGSGVAVVERLAEFSESIRQVGLPIQCFTARFLPLRDSFTDAKRRLLDLYGPIWGSATGVGAKQHLRDSRGARSVRSKWDELHPGRVGSGGIPRRDNVAGQLEIAIPRVLAGYRRAQALLASYQVLEGAQL